MLLMLIDVNVELKKSDQKLSLTSLILRFELSLYLFNVHFESYILQVLLALNRPPFSLVIKCVFNVFLTTWPRLKPREDAHLLQVCDSHKYYGVRDQHPLVSLAEGVLIPVFQD